MRELQRGLWWWEAVHPEWTAEDDAAGRDWGPEVSSYAMDDGERLLLIDPTTPPAPILELAAARETVIVLTNPWHERAALGLSESLGAPVFAPPPDDDGKGIRMPAELFSAGERLSFGVEAYPGREPPRMRRPAASLIAQPLPDASRSFASKLTTAGRAPASLAA